MDFLFLFHFLFFFCLVLFFDFNFYCCFFSSLFISIFSFLFLYINNNSKTYFLFFHDNLLKAPGYDLANLTSRSDCFTHNDDL